MRYCLDLPNAASIMGQWLFDWQTLISGILAVGAAYWAGCLIGKQIRQTEELHEKELVRHHRAVRAVLPLALSEISEFCRKIAENIASEIEVRTENTGTDWVAELAPEGSSKHLTDQNFPASTIPTFQAFIETLTDIRNIRHVAELISSLQIVNSRYCSFNLLHVGISYSLYGLLLDIAKVRVLSNAMFNYARFLDEGLFALVDVKANDVIWDKISVEAHSLIFSRKIPDLFFKEISERIERYKAANSSPWNEKFEQ